MPANCLLVAVIKMFTEMFVEMFTEMFVEMFIEMLIEIFTEMPIGMFAKSFVERLLRCFGWQPDPTNLRIANFVGHLYHFVSALESKVWILMYQLQVWILKDQLQGMIQVVSEACVSLQTDD